MQNVPLSKYAIRPPGKKNSPSKPAYAARCRTYVLILFHIASIWSANTSSESIPSLPPRRSPVPSSRSPALNGHEWQPSGPPPISSPVDQVIAAPYDPKTYGPTSSARRSPVSSGWKPAALLNTSKWGVKFYKSSRAQEQITKPSLPV